VQNISEDNILYTGEIYNLKIKANLVVLSSCESGYGYLDASEGILGLNRAFMYSGVPNVVYSLWKVYDKVSADLMINFYDSVLDNQNYAAALRASKLKMLEEKATASPHYWGAFLFMGG
jgi:CHAT domain-containing protein